MATFVHKVSTCFRRCFSDSEAPSGDFCSVGESGCARSSLRGGYEGPEQGSRPAGREGEGAGGSSGSVRSGHERETGQFHISALRSTVFNTAVPTTL